VLALTSQVLGWMLISSSLPRLPAALTSVLLLAQPGRVRWRWRPAAGRGADAGAVRRTALILAGVVSPPPRATRGGRRAGTTGEGACRGLGRAVEQARHRAVLEDLADGAGDERRDRQDGQPVEALVLRDRAACSSRRWS
jgi:hypothetical protein